MRAVELGGLLRSLAIYYGQPWRGRRRRAFYGQFVRPGGLAFDLGAHVGDRVRTWLQLGARVVAIEPQPTLSRVLARLYGDDPRVTLVQAAVGAEPGRATLHVSSRSPTVTTLSLDWMQEVQRDRRFTSIRWDQTAEVEVVTLDALVARHGVPDFCKIDVEGFELEVLRGLTRPLPALSFEYIPVAKGRALACLARLTELGDYELRASRVETTRWAQDAWLAPAQMHAWLAALPLEERSGDVYARLRG